MPPRRREGPVPCITRSELRSGPSPLRGGSCSGGGREEDRVSVLRPLVAGARVGHPVGRDALLQSIELAVAAEELGADGAYVRVHHFARQLASPFPLLAAVGARTRRIEIGTAVIDMRYENPFYMAEDAGAADLIAGGRLQLGISRGSPEQVIDGWRHFGHAPAEGETDADMARRHAELFLDAARRRRASPSRTRGRCSRIRPASSGWSRIPKASRAHLVGRGNRRDRRLGGQARHEPAELDPEVRRDGRALPHPAGEADPRLPDAWKEAGHAREPRVSVSRSIFALVNDQDRAYFGRSGERRTRSATSRRTPARSSVAPTPMSPTSWWTRSPRTRRSPRRTPCS